MKPITPSPPLYEHDKRPEWGPALLAWQREGRRGYLFEDGTLRVFAEPYCNQFKLRQKTGEPLSAEFRHHVAQLAVAQASKPGAAQHETVAFSVDEQAQLLLSDFPGGFSADSWTKKQRGVGIKKRLKRHRDAAVEDAQRTLALERLAQALEQGSHTELWRGICAMLRRTDLVALRDVRALEQNVSKAPAGLTGALAGMLQVPSDDVADDFADRFKAYVAELRKVLGGRNPAWQLITAPLALFDPRKHVCVHPASVRLQAKWLKQRPLGKKTPTAAEYERARRLAKSIADKLEELGVPTQDMLDVSDFMRLTTVPSARKRLTAQRHVPAPPVETTPPPALEEPTEEVSGTRHAIPNAPDATSEQEAA